MQAPAEKLQHSDKALRWGTSRLLSPSFGGSLTKHVHAQQRHESASTPTVTGRPHFSQVNVFRFPLMVRPF